MATSITSPTIATSENRTRHFYVDCPVGQLPVLCYERQDVSYDADGHPVIIGTAVPYQCGGSELIAYLAANNPTLLAQIRDAIDGINAQRLARLAAQGA
jgi:hypothetical protein